MFCEKITFDKYKTMKQHLYDFVLDEQWRNSLMFDILISDNFYKTLFNTIQKIKLSKSNDELNNILISQRETANNFLLKTERESNVVEKWKAARLAYASYGLIEAITEGSVFSEKLLDDFKTKHGDNFLGVISELDKENPSILTNFFVKSKINKYDQIENKYLLLKKWQDDQNIYHAKRLYPLFEKARDDFEAYYDKLFGKVDTGAREKLALYNLRESKIITIDTLASLIDIGFGTELNSVVGGKAYGLAVLRNKELPIPNTFVIPVDNDFDNEILHNLDSTKKYAIRSSADSEDGLKNSFAGMFESFLDVSFDNVPRYFKEIQNSKDTERVKAYMQKFELKSSKMAVIIQEFCPAEKSGVWIGKGKNRGILEWTYGTGEKLVLGKITPKIEEVPNKESNNLMIDNKKVGEIMLGYQKKIDAPCDFEWCIADNKLIMLQYRPVTTNIPDRQKNVKGDIKGTPASAGFVCGKVCLLEDEDEIENFKKGSILLTYYTDPNWVTAMTQLSGIITAQGGFLCHTAIIARELGIPCITGIGDENLEFLAKQKEIILDATNGVINVKKILK